MNKNSGVQATTKGQVYLNESGILIQAYHDNIDLLLDDAREEFALYSKLCKSIKRPLLVDIRNIRSVERKAREFYSSPATSKYLKATALLIENPVSRIIGNFYLGLNKPVLPLRLFTNKEEAIDWLKSFL